jgi:hypothetical protein
MDTEVAVRKRPLGVLLVCLSLILVSGHLSSASAPVPSCFGMDATIVDVGKDTGIRGTSGDDVAPTL